jgi:hypothetical protein
LNTLSDDPVSQVFYFFYKELRFGDIHSHKKVHWLRVLLEPFFEASIS